MGVGTIIHRVNSRSGTPIEGTMEVVEYEPNKAIAMVIHDGPAEMRGRTTFEALNDNQTILTTFIEIPGMDDSMDKSFLLSRLERSGQLRKQLMEAEIKLVPMTGLRFLLQDLFSAGDEGNLEVFDTILDKNVIIHAPAGLSTVGIQQEKESWKRSRSVIPDLRHEFLELLSDGSTVAARCIVSGTLNGSLGNLSAQGRHFCLDQAIFAQIHNGKITEIWEIVDTASLQNPFTSTSGQVEPLQGSNGRGT
jgi:predicted ester cyclase